MYLKYVEIQGFKSFPDKTRIKFDRVLTGIVGPNGSGKSNISDAVKWVLGEQSSKNLRGGKMEDVIFGGTLSTRKPMGFAQVTLCLDNSDKKIADMGDEILVTRRYYRSGDSEYSVNGAAVRLRDVREMFMDTGLGRDGYSIIGQGKISEVVDSRPLDRREVFEEASGISKYRFRKNEAERKLEQAGDNIDRLRDIAGEIETRLPGLEEQSAKAQKFLEYSEEKKGLEITLYSDTVRRSRDSLKNQQEKSEIAKLDYQNIEEKLDETDRRIEDLVEDNNRREGLRGEYTATISANTAKITELESEAAVLRNEVLHAERDRRALEDNIKSISESGDSIQDQINEKNHQAEEKRAAAAVVDEAIAALEKEINELIEDSAATDKRRSEHAGRLAKVSEEISSLSTAVAAADSALEMLEQRSIQVDESIAAQKDVKKLLEQKQKENEKYLSDLEKELGLRTNEFNGYELKLRSKRESYDALARKLADTDTIISGNRQRIQLLSDMESSMEGYYPPVRKVVDAGNKHELKGILGTVGSLFSVKSGKELAIETALGSAMQNIITENERAAKDGINYLNRNKIGRATFMPLDTVTPAAFSYRDRLKDSGIVGLASDMVECDAKYRPVVDFLLGRIIIAEDLDSASATAARSGRKVKIVTLDGQVINAGGTYTGGYSAKQGGSFTRKADIDKLTADTEKLVAATADDRQKKKALNEEIETLTAAAEAVRADITGIREDVIRAQAEKDRVDRELQSGGAYLDNAAAELERIKNDTQTRKKEKAEAIGRISALKEEENTVEALLQADDSADGFMERRAILMDSISEKRVKKAELLKDAEGIDSLAAELRERGESSSKQADILSESIKSLDDDNARRNTELEVLEARIAVCRKEVERCNEGIADCATRKTENDRTVNELRTSRNSLTDERERIAGEMARLEERCLGLEGEYNSAVGKLWEEYQLTPAEATPFLVEFTGITELKAQVASVRAKIRSLGSINVDAIEEFKEQKQRYDFMSDQITDMEKSRKELLSLIDTLENEMKAIFSESFSAINDIFKNTFTKLFGGGKAELYLTDSTDILGSGIELDVQPPGKVIKNLSALSGGEKSLVAIAIYMAILEVNPSPFCILDEIDSALDESNVVRFAAFLKEMVDNTQMIAITHRRGTMEAADVLYGVTMQEEGVSMVLKLNIDEAEVLLESEKKAKGGTE